MTTPYPLEQLLDIKKRRLEEAERVFRKKKEILEKETNQLKKLEAERDQTLRHKQRKVEQFRQELDKGTTSDKIEIMRHYIQFIDEELKQKETKVQTQKKRVEEAEKELKTAREVMIKKQQEVEKLDIHKKEWEKENRALQLHAEELETDELGTTIHISKKYKG